MRFPDRKVPNKDGYWNHATDPNLLRDTDRRTLWLFLAVLAISLVALALMVLTDTFTFYEALPITALPLFTIGLINYIVRKRWVAAIAIVAASAVVYFLDPSLVLFLLYVLVCAEGVAVMVEVIQRATFYKILRSVEFVNIKPSPSPADRITTFMFNIPCDLDTRNLTMDHSIRRVNMPWRDMFQSMVLSLALCMFLWIYMFLNPAFHTSTSGLPIYTFTIILYVSLLVLPWSIMKSLNVRIESDYRDFRIYTGLLETIKRMFLPVLAALVFLALALSSGTYTLYYIAMSVAMIVIITIFTSVMYYTNNEADVVNDITARWREFHPADIYSGYEGTERTSSMDDGVPGTPRRDPRSCFPEDQR